MTIKLTVGELEALLQAAREAELSNDVELHLTIETAYALPRIIIGRADVDGEDIIADLEVLPVG